MEIRDNVLYCLSTDKTIDIVLLNNVNNDYPLHTHAEHFTIGIVCDGEITIENSNEKYVCKTDEVFTIPIDTPHSIKPIGDSCYTMLSVCIHQDCLIHADVEDIRFIINRKLSEIFSEEDAVEKYSELLSDSLILLLANKFEVVTDSFSNDIKQKLLNVFETSISIEDISNEICVSSFHMIRQFKKEIGLTPHQFQIQCRIRKAQKLLLSDKSIAEVALDTGFCDQSHFVKSFKKVVGMTPASYQKVAKLSKEQE